MQEQPIRAQPTRARAIIIGGGIVGCSTAYLGRETIYRDGVTADSITSGTYEPEVATERVPCTVSLKPLYDPTNSRVKA